MAATRRASRSAPRSGLITSRAAHIASRWPAWPPPRPRSAWRATAPPDKRWRNRPDGGWPRNPRQPADRDGALPLAFLRAVPAADVPRLGRRVPGQLRRTRADRGAHVGHHRAVADTRGVPGGPARSEAVPGG